MRATDLGILLIDALKGHFAFLEYDYTRSLEQQLDDIAEGKAQYFNVVSGIDGQLKRELAQLHIPSQPALASNGSTPAKTATAPPPGSLVCPKCRKGIVKKSNGQNFYGCSRYREGCNFNINETIAKKAGSILCRLISGCISLTRTPRQAARDYCPQSEDHRWGKTTHDCDLLEQIGVHCAGAAMFMSAEDLHYDTISILHIWSLPL